MIRDRDLLREYVCDRAEPAFSALVERHVNTVYSAALRQSRDPHTAADITQIVFITLARNAASIRNPDALSGWLFRTTRLTAARFARSEMRRRKNELAAMEENLIQHSADEPDWQSVAEHIDEAIATLSQLDQDAVALRFFEQKNMRQIGEILNLSEDAAQKRISRALEKLHVFLQRRGIATSAAALATGLTANAVHAAPIGLAASAGSVALAAAAQTAIPWTIFLMSVKAKFAIASLLLVAAISTTVAVGSPGTELEFAL